MRLKSPTPLDPLNAPRQTFETARDAWRVIHEERTTLTAHLDQRRAEQETVGRAIADTKNLHQTAITRRELDQAMGREPSGETPEAIQARLTRFEEEHKTLAIAIDALERRLIELPAMLDRATSAAQAAHRALWAAALDGLLGGDLKALAGAFECAVAVASMSQGYGPTGLLDLIGVKLDEVTRQQRLAEVAADLRLPLDWRE